uniref:Uncharacterized protein n=1 Tax=Triticum urartu TaxID=4572 RepID=A0A8R7UN24_TRIUA
GSSWPCRVVDLLQQDHFCLGSLPESSTFPSDLGFCFKPLLHLHCTAVVTQSVIRRINK